MKPRDRLYRLGAAGVLLGVTILATVVVPRAALAASHTPGENPFQNSVQYVNSEWSAKALAEANAQSDSTLYNQMKIVAAQATGVWLSNIASISGSANAMGLSAHLDAALAQKDGNGGHPEVITLVIYDLPGRDCNATASNGEIPATTDGLAQYKSQYIDAIASILGDSKYANLKIATVIEPDSLGNATTPNTGNPKCATAAPYYEQGIAYALGKLHAIGNVYTYLDATNASWMGWHLDVAIPEFKHVATLDSSLNPDGVAAVDGFTTNVSNYVPIKEPFLDQRTTCCGGTVVSSQNDPFYGTNHYYDEASYTAELYKELTDTTQPNAYPKTIGFIIDTGRNGWGGSARPTSPSVCTSVSQFISGGCTDSTGAKVKGTRVDLRSPRAAWCNPTGTGLGELPTGFPSGVSKQNASPSNVIAFLWVKPPGESDGSGDSSVTGYDPYCDPNYVPPKVDSNGLYTGWDGVTQTTGAMAGAPAAGEWFSSQFVDLVKNAYPVLPSLPGQAGSSCSVSLTSYGTATGLADFLTVTNTGSAPLTSWAVTWSHVDRGNGNNSVLPGVPQTAIYNDSWGGLLSENGTTTTLRNMYWNGTIQPGASTTAGFNAEVNPWGSLLWEDYTCWANVDNVNPPEGSACSATYKINSTTSDGFTGQVDVKNTGSVTLTSWLVTWDWPGGEHVKWVGGAGTGKDDTTFEATSLPYTSLQPGDGTTFTFEATGSNGQPPVTPVCYANGNTPVTPTPLPTAPPTPVPTASPTPVPTPVPTASPTPVPTASPTPVVTPSPAGPTCSASLQEQVWSNGFTANFTVTNTGSIAIKTWKVTWTWPNGEKVTVTQTPWGATVTTSGYSVTANSTNANGWNNNPIAVHGSTTFGFNANYTGTNSPYLTLTCSAT